MESCYFISCALCLMCVDVWLRVIPFISAAILLQVFEFRHFVRGITPVELFSVAWFASDLLSFGCSSFAFLFSCLVFLRAFQLHICYSFHHLYPCLNYGCCWMIESYGLAQVEVLMTFMFLAQPPKVCRYYSISLYIAF